MATTSRSNENITERTRLLEEDNAKKTSYLDGGYGWVVVFFAFLCNASIDGVLYSFGILQIEIANHFNTTQSTSAWIASLLNGFYLLSGPLVSCTARYIGLRKCCILGAVLASIGLAFPALTDKLFVLYISVGILGGIGFGFIYLSNIVQVGLYFDKKRAVANGITVAGTGVGIFAMAPILQYFVGRYGWTNSLLLDSGIILLCAFYGGFFKPIPIQHATIDQNTSLRESRSKNLYNLGLFKNPRFILLAISSFILYLGYFIPFVYLIPYSEESGVTKDKATFLISIMGVASTVGRVGFGFVTDVLRIKAVIVNGCVVMLGGITTFILPYYNTYNFQIFFSIMFGLTSASFQTLRAVVIVNILGRDLLSEAFGWTIFFQGLSVILGSPFAGWLYDMTKTYSMSFHIVGIFIFAAGLIETPLWRVKNVDTD